MNRRHRLTRSADFDAALRRRRRAASPLLVVYTMPNALGYPRVGLAVSRRLGSAVQRNRIKRLLREAARPLLRAGNGLDRVIVPRPPAVGASWDELRQTLQALWEPGLDP